MKKRLILGIVLLCGFLATLFFYFYKETDKLSDLKYETKTISYADANASYKIDGEYPLITAGVKNSVKNKINDEILSFAFDSVQKAKTDFIELAKETEGIQFDSELVYFGKAIVKSDLQKLPFINISFDTYYYSGGAHGINAITTFVYDANIGQRIFLKDIFFGEYLKVLSKHSLEVFKERDPGLTTYSFAEEGTTPLENNFLLFTLETDGLHLVFGDYQVGPYVAGRPEIVIPYEKLQEVIKPSLRGILK